MVQRGDRYLIRADLPNIMATLWLRLPCRSERLDRFGARPQPVLFIYCALAVGSGGWVPQIEQCNEDGFLFVH